METYVNEFIIQSGKVIKHESLTLKERFERERLAEKKTAKKWLAEDKLNKEANAKKRNEDNEKLGKKVLFWAVITIVVAIYLFTT
ncbi:hypothetical protein AB6E53_15340 [Vibrio breoganii]|uniref:hypothetical protein n=1 Tax=Vibrio breoganii TaxID=553239 RepID=UPI0010548EF6|nr:hypothetical protein [Vibrio breoganii]